MTISEWLESTSELRGNLLAYSHSHISSDPGARQNDVSKALEMGQSAGELLSDCDVYLSQATAKAILEARLTYDAQTSRVLAKGAVADIQRLRDGISVIYQTIKDRRFTLMSVGRW